MGITEKSIEEYTKYLCDIRLGAIGFKPLFGQEKNPYKHLDKLADLSKEAGTKANFFEASVTSYNMASSINGWSDF